MLGRRDFFEKEGAKEANRFGRNLRTRCLFQDVHVQEGPSFAYSSITEVTSVQLSLMEKKGASGVAFVAIEKKRVNGEPVQFKVVERPREDPSCIHLTIIWLQSKLLPRSEALL